MIVLFL